MKSSKPVPNAQANAFSRLIAKIDALGLNPERDRILLAVSGGPDSMAMARVVKAWKDNSNSSIVPLRALVVDHGLREVSSLEAATVADALNAMGIMARVYHITEKPPVGGIQVWARERRYRALVDHALADDTVIMTAHHADDQVETMAMRLDRGSGLRGLQGMRALSSINGLRLARPFLDVPRDELHEVLKDGSVPVVHDPSNHNRRFTRVRFREDMPELCDAGAGPAAIQRLGHLAGRIDYAFEQSLDRAIAGRAAVEAMGWAWFQRDLLRDLPSRAGNALLARLIRKMGAAGAPPREHQLITLQERLLKGDSVTLGGCEWRPWGAERIIIWREAERPSGQIELHHQPPDPGHGIFDRRWHIVAPFAGRVRPLGARGYAALRRVLPGFTGNETVPARAFWSMPVFIPDGTAIRCKADMGLLTLDDHGIIPHLNSDRNDLYSFPKTGPCAWFIGGATW